MNAPNQQTGSPKSSREAIELEVGPQVIWHTLTDPIEVARWLSPGSSIARDVGGTVRVDSLIDSGFEGVVELADSTRRLVARRGGSTVDELDFQIDRRGPGVMLRAVRTRVFASDGDERIASEAREWRFRWLALRQYVEKHRRAEPLIVTATIETDLAPSAAFDLLSGANGFARGGSIEKAQRRDRFEITTVNGEHLTGRVFVHEPHGQFIAALEGWPDALFGIEVLRGEAKTLVVARLRAFDVESSRIAEVESRWRAMLGKLFAS